MFLNKLKHFAVNITRHSHSTKQSKMWRVDDNRLSTFTRICNEISQEGSYLKKAKILQNFFSKGCNANEFQGDTLLWVRFLIPGDSQRVYNLQSKQMVKLFSRLFNSDVHAMQLDLEQDGDVSETLRKFFELSTKLNPQKSSTLYLQDVDDFLKQLEQLTKEDEQTEALSQLCKRSTSADLKTIIRIIKHDLRMNAKASHVLAAFGPAAYVSYQANRDLAEVVKQFSFKNEQSAQKADVVKTLKGKKCKKVELHVMSPISPMLANACNSVEEAFKKSPTGLFSEIKYDGERVQIHKQGAEFKFFSRNLKPVMDHKVRRVKEFLPKAFPRAGDMILDSEIILVDTVTDELLPFGSLGTHKKKEYPNAEVCLFVFDCILFQGKDVTNLSFRDRRKILEDNIEPIKSYVQLSESHFLKTKNELSLMTAKVLKANLEGVVLKDPLATYQPGKRGWLKVKKDYLFGGRMADMADLVVLGAWYGSGKKGGILSIFLMGCYDRQDRLWKTVTKVHTGLDDKTRLEIHKRLMTLMTRSDGKHVPTWFLCNKPLIPDMIAKDPKVMPVWEITGAEFTKSAEHTASGISIRFPRITRLREDKSADQANDLAFLESLFDASKSNVNVDLLIKECNNTDRRNDEDGLKINSKINIQKTPIKAIKIENISLSNNKKIEMEAPTSSIPKRKTEQDNYIQQSKRGRAATFKSCNKNIFQDELNGDCQLNTDKAIREETPMVEFKVEKESTLFKNLSASFENISDPEAIMKIFEANSGMIVADCKKVDIVFYDSYNVKVNLNDCRLKHSRLSHHLSTQWLLECVKHKKLLDYGLYAIVLK